MRILVLHQNKFDRMGYPRAFDHDEHDVVYAATQAYLDGIPADLRCGTVALAPGIAVAEQLGSWLRGQPRFDRIIARHEKLIMPAALLRAEFDVPGMRPDVALRFRDKLTMKTALASAGIRVPRFLPATDLPRHAPWPGRTVVKPRDGNASQGVVVCEDYPAARALVQERGQDFAVRHEVEEYVDGPVWLVDGFLFRGRPIAAQASCYVGTCLDFEHGHPSGTVQHHAPDLAEWAVRCVRALGADTLTFHLEAISTPQGPVFLEVAARCGGGHIVEMVRRRTGVHLHTVDMATDIRDELATDLIRPPEPGMFYGDFLYPGHVYDGAPVSVTVPPAILADPALLTYQRYPEGRPTTTSAGYRPENLPFSGMIGGTDPARLVRWLRELFATVSVVAPVRR